MEHLTQELEICVESLQACRAAADGGADRIELCAALNDGGVTPSRGFMRAAIAASKIPVHVLIRPRAGNFFYSEDEFAVMCADAADAVSLGAAGIVVGMLTTDKQIDIEHMRKLMQSAQGASITFHRAFDQLTNLPGNLEHLIDLGCSRVLTSGGRPTVIEGQDVLQKLAEVSAGRIRIAAGGGVTIENAAELAKIQGLDLHASLRRKASESDEETSDPLWINGDLDGSIDTDDVRRLRNQMRTASSTHATLVSNRTA